MSFFPKNLKNSWGSIGDGLMILTIISVLGVLMTLLTSSFSRALKNRNVNMNFSAANSSGVESMLLAYRLAEMTYIKFVQASGCGTANPFLQALKEGSGCSGSVSVFTAADAPFLSTDPSYTYREACTIQQSSCNCGIGTHELVYASVVGTSTSAPGTAQSDPGYHFMLNSIRPEKALAEFVGIYNPPLDGTTQTPQSARYSFAIRAGLTNAAHLEVDGRVTQENPEPLSKCPGTIWASFLVFDPGQQKCLNFVQLGSGTGLGFYKGRYFGFRPSDGQIIDLMAATTATTYLVEETGKLSGTKIFVPYSQTELINVDDITLIGDQLYYVAGMGGDAHIGVLKDNKRYRICELGAKGWGQSYEGIAAAGFSDPLLPIADDGMTTRMATFFLKTTAGDLLTAVLIGAPDQVAPTEWNETGSGPFFSCSVFKDSNLQQVEYKRTNGFDRTDNSKPYYLY